MLQYNITQVITITTHVPLALQSRSLSAFLSLIAWKTPFAPNVVGSCEYDVCISF